MTFGEIIKGMEEKQFEYGFQYVQDSGKVIQIILGKKITGEVYVQSIGELFEEKNLKILENNINNKKEWLPAHFNVRDRLYHKLYIILKNKDTGETLKTSYKNGDFGASINGYIEYRKNFRGNSDVMSIYVIENYRYKEIYEYNDVSKDSRI